MNLGEYLKALCSCFYLKKNGYASARNWWKIQQHGNSCQSPEQSATLSGMTWSNVRPHLCLYFPFHPSVCSHPWTVPLSLPFPFSRKQVLLGWVRASYRGGASRGADKGSLCREEVITVQHREPWHTGQGVGIAADGCLPMFLQQHLTVIFPYQKSHTSPSLHPVLNTYKKLGDKATRALYILKK